VADIHPPLRPRPRQPLRRDRRPARLRGAQLDVRGGDGDRHAADCRRRGLSAQPAASGGLSRRREQVARTLNVTFSNWEPQGSGTYDITPYKTVEVKSSANGKFEIPNVTTKTEETVFIEAVGDGESELSTVTQEVNIQRIVTLRGFNLHGQHGTLGIWLEAGELEDLYYVDSQPVTL
jgi:hypothetical protein